MATIVTRSGKGSALTFAEGDANFTNLNNDKLENITNENIGDLSDVTIAAASNGQVLAYDSATSQWLNTTLSSSSTLDALTDTNITGLADGQYLTYNSGSSEWQNVSFNQSLDDLSDVSVSSAGPGQVLGFVSGSWQPTTVSTKTDLNSLDDVTISNPSTGNILQYGPSGWENQAASFQLSSDFGPQLAANLDSNDFSITNSNAGGDVTLSPNSGGKSIVNNINYYETPYALGSTDTPTINVANGNVQTVTITSGLTLPTFTSAITGQSVTLIVTGSGTATGASGYKFAGGSTTLTSFSVVSVYYDGTNYWASIATDFQ